MIRTRKLAQHNLSHIMIYSCIEVKLILKFDSFLLQSVISFYICVIRAHPLFLTDWISRVHILFCVRV